MGRSSCGRRRPGSGCRFRDDGQGAGDLAAAVIEEALGDEADGILPQAIRTAELRVRLPRHHIDMLEYRADQQETTVSGVLERELDGIASAHLEELSAALPGFAEAMAWPAG